MTPKPPQKILAIDKKNTALNVVQSEDIYNVYILYLKSDIVNLYRAFRVVKSAPNKREIVREIGQRRRYDKWGVGAISNTSVHHL